MLWQNFCFMIMVCCYRKSEDVYFYRKLLVKAIFKNRFTLYLPMMLRGFS